MAANLLAVHPRPVSPGRRSPDVDESRFWTDVDAPAALLQAPTEIDLFVEHEEARIECADLVDCLAAIPALRRTAPGPKRVLDVGSGGGLPGLVWAVVEPQLGVTCVDSVGKKTAFIQQAALELQLANVRVEHARVEQLRARPFDVVASRAFASLADFVALTGHLATADGVWVAMKGKLPLDEIASLPADFQSFHVERLDVPGLDAERCLVWIRRMLPPLDVPESGRLQ